MKVALSPSGIWASMAMTGMPASIALSATGVIAAARQDARRVARQLAAIGAVRGPEHIHRHRAGTRRGAGRGAGRGVRHDAAGEARHGDVGEHDDVGRVERIYQLPDIGALDLVVCG